MMKVQPLTKPKLGKFTKYIKFLSTFYIVPLTLDANKSTIKFSFFSFKSFVNVLLISTPFIFLLLWNGLFSHEEFIKVWDGYFKAYESGDVFVMIFFPGNQFTPLGVLTFAFALSKSVAKLPDVVFDVNSKMPHNMKTLILVRGVEVLGFLMVAAGNYYAVGPFTSLSAWENFVNISLTIFIPASLMAVMFIILSQIYFGLLENVELRLRSVPRVGVQAWVRGNVDLFKRYQETSNITVFAFVAYR